MHSCEAPFPVLTFLYGICSIRGLMRGNSRQCDREGSAKENDVRDTEYLGLQLVLLLRRGSHEHRSTEKLQRDKPGSFRHELERRTLSTMRHSCVARRSCWRFEIRGSITKCSRISVQSRTLCQPPFHFVGIEVPSGCQAKRNVIKMSVTSVPTRCQSQ